MPIASNIRLPIAREDAATALVEQVGTRDAEHQQAAAAQVIKHWEAADWPAGLLAQSLFLSTDGRSLLTYGQWSAASAGAEAPAPRPRDDVRPDWRALGVEPGVPQAFELYRVVQPAVLPDPVPDAQCFPGAFFAMESRDAAREWVDGLLDNEEQNEGTGRAYPGALAANFHVAADGTRVFLLSEWVSEAEAVAHIEAVIEPLLEYMGQAEAGAGSRYVFFAAVSANRR